MLRTRIPREFTPSVQRYWLKLTSGLLWSGAGVLLCVMAAHWLADVAWPLNLIVALVGFAAGVAIYSLAFSRIARKNIVRIMRLPAKACFFAFQAWKSYVLIVLMMLLGLILRHSPLPKVILSAIYFAIGTALAFSSTVYYE